MRSTTNTHVKMAFYSKDEDIIKEIKDILENYTTKTFSELLKNFAPLDNKHQLSHDGKLLFDDKKIYDINGFYAIYFMVDFKGLFNMRLSSISNLVLDKKFGKNKVKLVYFDESARINSDDQAIVFDTRIKIEYDIFHRYNIRTEYYTSNQDLINIMKQRNIILNEHFDISEYDDVRELRNLIEHDNIFINITYYDYEYDHELDNTEIQKFLDKF